MRGTQKVTSLQPLCSLTGYMLLVVLKSSPHFLLPLPLLVQADNILLENYGFLMYQFIKSAPLKEDQNLLMIHSLILVLPMRQS